MNAVFCGPKRVAYNLVAMLNLGLWSGGVILLLLILNLAQTAGRSSGSVFRRSWSGSLSEGLAKGVEEALLEVQAIEQPEKRHSGNEHKATKISFDDSGGPDDPARATERKCIVDKISTWRFAAFDTLFPPACIRRMPAEERQPDCAARINDFGAIQPLR